MVYSSLSGTFEDVYELMFKVGLFDDVVFARGDDAAFFRGFFPSLTLADELEGACDGRDSGTLLGMLEQNAPTTPRPERASSHWSHAVRSTANGSPFNAEPRGKPFC